jgi:serine/threonine-protein kinase
MMAAMSGIPAGAGQLLGKRLGKFEILALLALGGTAEIYLARIGGAAGFEKYVVVKCLHDHLADDAEFVKMFLDEARLAAHLDHSNIVQTMELGQHDGRYYMVMEFLAGLSLAMVVRRAAERLPSQRVPLPLVLNILAQSCAGLHYAHEKAMNGKALNIVHRDISPQNLVISFEGVVKLVDFGIAKAEMRETRTRSGTIKGKFAYMSPEQCVANNVDRRTDVFALGVIGHELLTGRRLFKRPSPYETYQAVIECDVKPPSQVDPGIDPALDAVIMRAITKDKADRYPTAEAFGDALLGYLHHRGIGSGPGDVSRFFDAQFAQEIEEHSMRMRELIAGRDMMVETSVSWGDDDVEDSGAGPAGTNDSSNALRAAEAAAAAAAAASSESAGSLSRVIDGLGEGSRGEDDDEMPAERTRIESNPLERINELERMVAERAASARPRVAAASARAPTDKPLPSSAVPVPPPPRTPAAPAPGRFPDPANQPTMIAPAAPIASGALDASPSLVDGTVPAAPSYQPGGNGSAAARGPAPPRPPPPGGASRSHPPTPSLSPSAGPALPSGYPVMNAQLSEQIATGATVFPSERRGAGPSPGPVAPHLAPAGTHPPPMGGAPLGPPGALGAAMGQPGLGPPPGGPMISPPGVSIGPAGAAPAPGFAPSGFPPPGFPPPGGPPGFPPPSGVHVSAFDPHGVNASSQAGALQRDWAALVMARLRNAPPWVLAVLFVGTIGVALALTIVIARIFR